jgi:Polycystin cation channel
MDSKIDNEVLEYRKKYVENLRKIKKLSKKLEKELDKMRKLEETTNRLEKNINNQIIDIKTLEKHNFNLKSKINQRKNLKEPEKNQIKDIKTFVKASKSIFTLKAFETIKNDPQTQEILGGRSGEVLLEIAKISEQVSGLKENINELKRSEIELKGLKQPLQSFKKSEISSEIQAYNEKTIKIRYKNLFNKEESCDFPMIDHLDNKLSFQKLLENACRYWDLDYHNHILMDENLIIWPGTKFIIDEVKDPNTQVWVMSKQEVVYYKASLAKKDPEKEVLEDPTSLESYVTEEISEKVENKNLAKVETDPKKVAESKERYKNVFNLLLYSLFIGMFTWSLSQSNPISTNFRVIQGLANSIFQSNFPVPGTSITSFSTINLYQDFENFLTGPFLNTVFQSSDYNNASFSDQELYYTNYVYRKIGPIRFLQKKVIPHQCNRDYSGYLGRSGSECFKSFSSADEYKETLNISGIPPDWLVYQSFSSPRAAAGVLNNYDLNGYVAYLDPRTSKEEALRLINSITAAWIDLRTRFLAVDMNFCNYNIDLCVSVEILFEFIAGGGVLAQYNIYTYRVYTNKKTSDKIRIAFDALSGAVLGYFLIDFIAKVKNTGCKASFKSTWNLLLLLIIAVLFSKYMVLIAYQNLGDIKNFNDNSLKFIDYMSAAYFYNLISNFEGISSFFVYFYILNFFKHSKSLKIIWGTLRHSIYRLVFFFLVFLLVFVGWMLLAYKGFGQHLSDYRDLPNTASTLLQMLLGNINFEELYAVQPEFAGLFFFSFIFLNFFVMLNIFLAIINEAYDTYYKKIKLSTDVDEMIIVIGILLKGLKFTFLDMPLKTVKFGCCQKKK